MTWQLLSPGKMARHSSTLKVKSYLRQVFLEWFAEEAPRVYGDVIPHSQPGFRLSVMKEPVGVVGLVTP